jgi:hypothetical protein
VLTGTAAALVSIYNDNDFGPKDGLYDGTGRIRFLIGVMSSSPRTQSRPALAKCFLANAGRPDKEVLGFLASRALCVNSGATWI